MPRGYKEVIDKPPFKPGFRWNWFDIGIIAGGSLFAFLRMDSFSVARVQLRVPIPYQAVGACSFLPIFTFFLFCNVFRVSRPLELGWAALYVFLMMAVIRFEALDWRLGVGQLIAAMAIVIAIEMRRPSYHGVGWQRINPRLPEWWEHHQRSG